MKISTTLYGDLNLIPYPPEVPIVERLEWLTDVFVGNDGTETRTQKRSAPRQTFEYTIPLVYWKKLDSINTLKGGIRGYWAVPIWTEAQYVGNITGAQTVVTCDTHSNYFLDENELVFFHSEGSKSYQWGRILSVSTANITMNSFLLPQAGAWLMPMKKALIIGDVKHITNGGESFVQIKFAIDEPLQIGSDVTNPLQFIDDDIYYFETICDNRANRKISQIQDIIDFDLGYIKSLSSHNNSSYIDTLRFILDGPAEIREYKEFLFRRIGRLLQFWLPTFEDDIEHVSTGAITTTLLVKRDSIDEFMLDRVYICVFTNDGLKHPVEIDSIQIIDSERAQFNFDSSIGIDASEIVKISYLGYNRLDTDSVELRWIGNGVVESEVTYVETNLFSDPVVIVE